MRSAVAVVAVVALAAGGLTIVGCQRAPTSSTGKGAVAEPRTAPAPDAGEASVAVPGTVYTCPMHPEVTSDKPGKCPECGMTLVVKKAAAQTAAPKPAPAAANDAAPQETKAVYACPMHPEVTSDKSGKCPECGMTLELKKS